MRWWAASPSPNCKSTTLSIPNCLDYQTIVIIKIMSIKPILLDMHQTLVVDVFSQLHWKSRRCWILWPFKFCSMQPAITKHYMLLKQVYFSLESPCAWLYQEHYFLVRLVQFDQISLVVNIVHLILCVLFWKQLQCSHTWLTRIPTYCCNSSKMEMMSRVVNLTIDLQPFSQMQGWFWKFKGLQGRNQTTLRNGLRSTKPDLHPGPPPPFLGSWTCI